MRAVPTAHPARVASDAVRSLVKYLGAGSAQTKEAASRALRQIAVEVTVRGALVQQGALMACCTAACDEDNKVEGAVGEVSQGTALITVTGVLTVENHAHGGRARQTHATERAPAPRLRERRGRDLQQFETLLALTNLLSCGPAEQEKFAAEKGVAAVHYLIFSENWMAGGGGGAVQYGHQRAPAEGEGREVSAVLL